MCIRDRFSGGYPGIFVSTAYLILILFFYRIFIFLKNKKFKKAKKLLFFSAFSLFVFLLLSSVALMGLLDTFPYVNRGAGLSEEGIMVGSLPWQAISSFIFPYVTTTQVNMWGSDWSLVNCYFGFFPLLILVLIFFQKLKDNKLRWLVLVGGFFLMMAMATTFPFRRWAYHSIPLMDLFRLSSFFRIFTIFFFLLGSGFALEYFFSNKKFQKKIFPFGLMVVVFLVISIFISYSLTEEMIGDTTKTLSFLSKMRTQSFIHLFFLTILLLGFYFIEKNTSKQKLLLIISCLDLFIMVQLHMNATIIHDFNPTTTNQTIHKIPKGFPKLSLEKSFAQLQQFNKAEFSPLHINLAHFYKIPAADGNSPLSFNWTNQALELSLIHI